MNKSSECAEQDAFERELEVALRRVAPPDGFAERVRAHAYPALASTPRGFERQVLVARPRLWLALAACLLFAVLSFLGEQHHERKLRRQEAQARFEMSMAITRQTLAGVDREARQQLKAAGIELEP